MSKRPYYKYCIVPCCPSTTVKTKGKVFFHVPKDAVKRKKWTDAMKRDTKLNPKLSALSTLWCCEDHFSLPDDMENYWRWRLTNVKRVQLKSDVVPHIFDCQKKCVLHSTERTAIKKRITMHSLQEALSSNLLVSESTSNPISSQTMNNNITDSISDTSHSTSSTLQNESVNNPQTEEKKIQVNLKNCDRSKGTNIYINTTSEGCSAVNLEMEEDSAEVATAVKHLLSEAAIEVNGTSDYEEEEIAMEVVKDDECVPARLVISGFNDENEEVVQMTIEEACNYVTSKVESFIRDPNVNPLLLLKAQISTLEEKIKTKNEEFTKLNKMFDALYRDQVKFLRYIGVIPKVASHTVGVSVDLPWLPETVSGIIREDLMKKSSENKSGLLNFSGNNKDNSGTTSKHAKKSSDPIECIDLTDDDVPASTSSSSSSVSTPTASSKPSSSNVSSTKPSIGTTDLSYNLRQENINNTSITITPINPSQNNSSTSGAKINDSKHPAPLPLVPASTDASEVLPKPELSISSDKNGIVLQWDYPPEIRAKKIMGYEIVGYQEKSNLAPSLTLWKKIGCVSPMPLPMSCTLTQFVEGYRYHFAIRALNKDCKPGHFSNPATIMFNSDTKKKTVT